MTGINTNLGSLIAQNQLGKNVRGFENITQRIATGIRINSARDDAAGLAIAERLLAQSTGFTSAQRATGDTIGFYQVQDSALSSIQENLQRMRELSLQAANGTLTDGERQALDFEYQQLSDENSRVIRNTTYNGVRVFGDEGLTRQTAIDANGNNVSLTSYNTIQNSSAGRGLNRTGSLSSFWNQVQVPGRDPATTYGTAGVAMLNNFPVARGNPITNYNVNVAQLGRSQMFTDNVGAGNPSFGANAVPIMSGIVSGNSINLDSVTTAGRYDVNVTQVATAYDITELDNLNGVNGVAARNFATTNSNPAVATITAAEDSNADYALTVTQIARTQVSEINIGTGTRNLGGISTATVNIDFAAGADSTFNINDGTLTGAEYAAALTANSGGRLNATFNGATGVLRLESVNTGTNNAFTVNVTSLNAGPANQLDVNAGDTVTAAQNATGTLNGQAFNSQSNNGITVNAAGDAGRTATFNVLSAGNTNFQQRQATVNTFNVTFGDGAVFNVTLPNGTFTRADYINAINTQTGGRISAVADGVGVRYVATQTGTNNSFVITNQVTQVDDGVNGAFAGTAGFNSGDAVVNQAAQNLTGSVTYSPYTASGFGPANAPVAFGGQSNNNISTFPGLQFDALTTGTTRVERTESFGASQNDFTVTYADGSTNTFSAGPGGQGAFTAMQFVSAFNSANAGKAMASYDAGTGLISYQTLQTGTDNAITSINSNSTRSFAGIPGAYSGNDVLRDNDRVVGQTAQNFTGDVDGVAFNSADSNFTVTVGGDTLDLTAQSIGSTLITFDPGTDPINDGRFKDIKSLSGARDEISLIDSYMSTISNSRTQAGAFVTRLEAIADNLATQFLQFTISRDRIVSADFAVETARLTRFQILQQAGTAVLGQANADQNRSLSLLDSIRPTV